MSFHFGAKSKKNLLGVDKRLIEVVRLALSKSSVDFMVIEGLRSLARQESLYALGRTIPGKIVTWTKNSKHCSGLAIDILPINPETEYGDWDYKEGFVTVALAMFLAANELSTPIRWGSDWDLDGTFFEKGEYDSPHFELV